jgi:hypothetical protein
VSPILVRPVREQLEHDRVIRLLQGKCKRKYDAGINPGSEQNVPVLNGGGSALYPDLVLSSLERGHKVEVVVEVETGESVNHLEALAQWAHFAKLRASFHLYVPSTMIDVARRLCDDNQIVVGEIWSYHGIGDDVRFTLVHRSKETPQAAAPVKRAPVTAPPSKAAPAAKAKKVARTAAPARPTAARTAKPAAAKKPVAKKAAAKKPARPQKRR